MMGRIGKKSCAIFSASWLIIFCVPILVASGQESYNWPLKPFYQQHWINGTFCENRPWGNILRHHFHNGVDIHLPENGEVYSVVDGIVAAVDPYRNGGYIRIGRFAYVHVTPNPSLQVGDMVKAYETIIGTTDSHNHIHFVDGYPGDEINPLRDGGGVSPFEDNFAPMVEYVHFYPHGTATQFPEDRVTGCVDIMAGVSDRTDDGPMGDHNGIYRLGYQIFAEDGVTPISAPIIPFTFYHKLDNCYIENVYAPGSDLSTYIYIPSNRIGEEGYWDTTQLQPGQYVVAVFTEDTRFLIDSLKVPIAVMAPDSIPPPPPRWQALITDDQQNVILSWQSFPDGQANGWAGEQDDSSDVAGFRLYYSYNEQSWYLQHDEKVLADTVRQIQLTDFTLQQPIFFQLTAVDNAAIRNESRPAEVYGVRRNSSAQRILIIDGADQMKDEGGFAFQNFVLQYQQLLLQLGDYGFEVCSEEAIRDSMVNLERYDCLIYFSHRDSSREEVLSSQEQDVLQKYLEGGGAVFITGAGIGKALHEDTTDIANYGFYRNVLRAEYDGWVIVDGQIAGCAGSIFSDLHVDLTNSLYSQWIETLLPQGQAQAAFMLDDSTIVGLQYCGEFGEALREGKLVYLAFPFENIASESAQRTVLKQVLEFFFAISVRSEPEAQDQKNITEHPRCSLNCYPNPFGLDSQQGSGSKITTIRFELSQRQNVIVTIYNILGQRVRTLLFNSTLAAGFHALVWDGGDEIGEVVPSGIYFCQLQTEHGTITQKILFLGSLTNF